MMKKFVFFSAMALWLFAGCGEDGNENPSGDYIDPNASIVGVWELVRDEYYENGRIIKDETWYYEPMEQYMELRDDLTMRYYDYPPLYWDGTYIYDPNTHVIDLISGSFEDPLVYTIEKVIHLTATELKIKSMDYWTANDLLIDNAYYIEVYRRTTLPD